MYNGRPPSANVLLPLYLAQSSPRPSIIYLPSTNPPTILASFIQDNLLFLSPSSHDTDPLAILEFLHRVADALTDFLGNPLLATKITSNYSTVAQLLAELCDAGTIATTEPNALRDLVDAPSTITKLLSGVGLPSSGTPSLGAPSSGISSLSSLNSRKAVEAGPAIPWRRQNVRHTSNELYVDIVETLHVTYAPSGLPLSALAYGSVAFTAKVSGVPDLLLRLSAPGGSATKSGIEGLVQLPVFHPCVRLARWKERPGELSFVPPDGKCVVMGYEVDLLGDVNWATAGSNLAQRLKNTVDVPVNVDVRTGLGAQGADFEVRLLMSNKFARGSTSGHGGGSGIGGAARGGMGRSASGFSGTSGNPTMDEITISVPIPHGVRNLGDLRPSRGEAHYSPGDAAVEWRIVGKEAAALSGNLHSAAGGIVATLRCTVIGTADEDDNDGMSNGLTLKTETWDYDEDLGLGDASQSAADEKTDNANGEKRLERKMKQNSVLMPTSAKVSFQVKGWLASGIKVDKLVIDTQKSRGLGAGVQPYKGVKYLTVSRGGVEMRC